MNHKAKGLMNQTWGIIKRARVDTLSKRLYLMDTLAMTAGLYGVEIWGWAAKEKIEQMKGRGVKMAMGLNINTPGYIWRMESGRNRAIVETRRRLCGYILKIIKMGEERWPRICLSEELRWIKNREPTKWGSELKAAWDEVGEGELLNIMLDKEMNISKIMEKLANGIRIKEEQEVQKDWENVDKSRYWDKYKNIKSKVEEEEYWEDKNLKGKIKEEWARLRCGNLSKEGCKGYRDNICRVCKEENETLGHIWECKKAREETDCLLIGELDKWAEEVEGKGWEEKLMKAMTGKCVKVICEYAINFERLVRKRLKIVLKQC